MKVVFHADDFGLSRAVNDGILEGHASGLLGSTSLMVTATAADDAARLARSHPDLDLGLHVTLVEEAPVLPPDRLPTIVVNGRFWPHHATVALRWATARWRPAEAAAEVAAQWQRFDALGLVASHVDGHQHLHLLPGVFPAVVAEAARRGVRFVRTTLADPLRRDAGALRQALRIATRAVGRFARRRLPAADRERLVPVLTLGFLDAGGTMTVAGLLAALDRVHRRAPGAIVEVMLHPGHEDADTRRRYGHWGYRWERDLALVRDPALVDGLAARGIAATSFRALATAPGRDAA
jgi:predicted glycoside hydrolase/deacetylase ChbG (UPF0249 family)